MDWTFQPVIKNIKLFIFLKKSFSLLGVLTPLWDADSGRRWDLDFRRQTICIPPFLVFRRQCVCMRNFNKFWMLMQCACGTVCVLCVCVQCESPVDISLAAYSMLSLPVAVKSARRSWRRIAVGDVQRKSIQSDISAAVCPSYLPSAPLFSALVTLPCWRSSAGCLWTCPAVCNTSQTIYCCVL